MIVVDASAMVEALVGFDPDPTLLDALTGDVAAPHLLDVEVLSVLRRLTLGEKLDAQPAERARHDLFALTIHRYELAPMADRVWRLRHQFTAYDATYLALAEGLDAHLLTCDTKLAAAGHSARVQVVTASRR